MITRYNMYPAASVNGKRHAGASARDRAISIVDDLAKQELAPVHEDRVDRIDLHADSGGQHAPS